ncbi:putative vacuolar protein sorting-associated protein TDA6 [Grifola frondosa]|uniref:Putative vacuolar protein sorting-associated protein TDA6 n=1 Tax=Grifola frondosa TaxID=5627 RepID=A0A1C7MW02_GRIFR|nr:putative vacuolar protein sorting-associated protein TDA6 [Grifola frondosa]
MVARSVLSVLLVSLSVAASPLKLAKREPIPDFVLANAPISHLWSEESWWPSDIAVHLTHVVPEVDFDDVASSVTFTTISTLASDVFLTSKDDVLTQPAWMTSAVNEPDSNGHSGAPATIICVEKEGGILDAFFFYFYSFNSGGKVLDIEFGDHIGDWEHSMVRFVNSEPSVVYLSAHSGGSAFTFDTMQTTNGRPTTYIAGGTHANYATPGNHYHDLPPPLLFDMTDAGLLWDPMLNFRGFWFDNSTGTFSIAGGADIGGTEEGSEGVGWLNFEGMWGDEQYPILEHGQYCVELGSLSECRFSSGPTGEYELIAFG